MERPTNTEGAGQHAQDLGLVPDLEEALQHFAHLVEAYYDSTAPTSSGAKQVDAPHALLQAVLDVYEQCKGTAGGVVVVRAEAAAGQSGREHLQRIGFVPLASPEGKSMRLVYHDHLEAYESAKSRARSEYHAKRAQQHEADFMGELAGIFDMRHIVRNDDNPHETLFFPEEEDDGEEHRCTSSLPQAKVSVAAFVQKYYKVVGTTPFLKGLRRILEQQVGQTVALQWTLAISVFTESGGPSFLSEALALVHVLRFRPLKLVHTDDGMVSVTWRMCADLSDKDITSLLRAGLTNNGLKKMPGSATGTVAISDVQRRLPHASSVAPPAHGLKVLLRKMKISS